MKRSIFIVIVLIIAALLTGCSDNLGKETMGTETETGDRSYTTEYLNSVRDDVVDYLLAHEQSEDELFLAIIAVYVNEGRVIVELDKVTDHIINLFKEKISDSDAIIFEVGEPYHFLSTPTNTP
jgi:hypothetical protein